MTNCRPPRTITNVVTLRLNKINEFNFTIISLKKKSEQIFITKAKLKKKKINWISLTCKHPPVLSTLVDLIKQHCSQKGTKEQRN